MASSNFRSSVSLRRRHFTPEPSLTIVPAGHHVIDHRRYSTAGNLDIYRPKSQRVYSYEWPLYDRTSSYVDRSSSPIVYWRAPTFDGDVKVTETRSHNNGPLSSSLVTYLPLSSRSTYSSLPSSSYLTSLEKQYYPRALTPSVVGRKAHDTQYDVDKYENSMKRVFGNGPWSYSYPSSYYSPSYTTSSYVPRYSNYYYDRPYYSDSYSYPYYYTSPYYSSYYNPYSYRDYYGYRDLGYYGSAYYPSRYTYGYAL